MLIEEQLAGRYLTVTEFHLACDRLGVQMEDRLQVHATLAGARCMAGWSDAHRGEVDVELANLE